MGQHLDIFPKHIGDTDIIARFRVRQLRVGVAILVVVKYRQLISGNKIYGSPYKAEGRL